MSFKNPFKREDNLTKELKMLPRETKKRILENVSRRRNEILEEKILEKQLKDYSRESKPKKTWGDFKEGMQKRREELKKQGILKPVIRYNKQNFQSPLEEMSRKARANEIKRLEDQRNKLKSGHLLGDRMKIKIKPLKLKSPIKDNSFSITKRKKFKNGLI